MVAEARHCEFTGLGCQAKVSSQQLHVVMEATSVYHEQAALVLAVRTKTDGVDSFVLARYGTLLKPAAWTPPPRKRRCCKRCWLGFGSAEQLAA